MQPSWALAKNTAVRERITEIIKIRIFTFYYLKNKCREKTESRSLAMTSSVTCEFLLRTEAPRQLGFMSKALGHRTLNVNLTGVYSVINSRSITARTTSESLTIAPVSRVRSVRLVVPTRCRWTERASPPTYAQSIPAHHYEVVGCNFSVGVLN